MPDGTWSVAGCLSCTAVTEVMATPRGEKPASMAERQEERRDLPCRIEMDGAGNVRTVFYEECDDEGNVTGNVLEFLGDAARDSCLHLTRRGPVSASFLFAVGRETATELTTPYGTIALTMETLFAEIKRDRQQIELTIRYRFLEAPEEAHEVRYRIAVSVQ